MADKSCPQCQQAIDSTALFCPHCGQAQPATAPPAPPTTDQAPARTPLKPWLWVIAAALVLWSLWSLFGSSGRVEVGRTLDRERLAVVDATPPLRGSSLAWVARLRGPANTTRLYVNVVRLQGGSETPVIRREFAISSPQYDTIGDYVSMPFDASSGRYKLTITTETSVLAEGTFDYER